MHCRVGSVFLNDTSSAINSIISNAMILTGSNLTCQAGVEIVLEAGFEVELSGEFNAIIQNKNVLGHSNRFW